MLRQSNFSGARCVDATLLRENPIRKVHMHIYAAPNNCKSGQKITTYSTV